MTRERPAAWQEALDTALHTATTPLPATAVLAGRSGTPGDAETLRSLFAWFQEHARPPVLDATGDDGALALTLAAAGLEVLALRDGEASERVAKAVSEADPDGADRVTVIGKPPDEVGCVLLAGSMQHGWNIAEIAPEGTPVLAAVDSDGLAEIAQHCHIEHVELAEGTARVRGEITADSPDDAVAVVAARLAAYSRAQLVQEQTALDDEDVRWRQTSAETRALQAEREAREATREADRAALAEKEARKAERAARRAAEQTERAARRAAEQTERRAKKVTEAQRRRANQAEKALSQAREELEEAAQRDEYRRARIIRLTDQVERQRQLREAMQQRRWWRLGEILAAARRSPKAALAAPIEIIRLLRKR